MLSNVAFKSACEVCGYIGNNAHKAAHLFKVIKAVFIRII
jgi:hypothetical protein